MSLPHKLRAYYDKVDFYWFFVIDIIVDFFRCSVAKSHVLAIYVHSTHRWWHRLLELEEVNHVLDSRELSLRMLLLLIPQWTGIDSWKFYGRRNNCQGCEGTISSRFLTRFLEHALRDLDFEVNINLLTYFIIYIQIDIESIWTFRSFVGTLSLELLLPLIRFETRWFWRPFWILNSKTWWLGTKLSSIRFSDSILFSFYLWCSGWFFNWSSQFSVPKWKTYSANKELSYVGKVAMVNCNSFCI